METSEVIEQTQSRAGLLDTTSGLVRLAAIVLGILASCMLLAGYSYYLGYIQAFGLDSSLIGRGLGDVVTESWFVGITVLVFFTGYVFHVLWVAVGMAVFLLLVLSVFVWVREKRPEWISKPFGKQHQGPTVLGFTLWQWWVWVEAVVGLAGWLLWFFVPLFVAIMVLVYPYQTGKREAERRIVQHGEHGCNFSEEGKDLESCFSLVDISRNNTLMAKGIFVASSDTRVALFNESGLEVWPLLDTYVLSRPYSIETDRESN